MYEDLSLDLLIKIIQITAIQLPEKNKRNITQLSNTK